ncbi:MAG: hypothetical protein KC561_20715, partial [Myxococcales bacterium]|nr:hypothetical protein [Myxococcales bacterium]
MQLKKGETQTKRLPWDQLPPGVKASTTRVKLPDGRTISAWQHHVETWRQKLKSGEIPAQSRWEVCDWVQDPVSKKWSRSWDGRRQTCATNENEIKRRENLKKIADPKSIPKGPHVIHPDEAQGDGANIPQAKVTSFSGLVYKFLRARLADFNAQIGTYPELGPVLIESIATAAFQRHLRSAIAYAIHQSGTTTHIDLRSWKETRKYSITANALGAIFGSNPMKTFAAAITVRHLYPVHRAAIPKAIEKHKA